MESVSSRQRPKLDRRNALKHIDYEASRSAPQSPSHSRFIDEDHVLASHSHSRFIDEDRVLGGSLTSFRVHGVDGKQEIERICKILGLSGPEAFAIPTAAWEARKAKSLSKPNPPEEEQSQKIEGKSDGFRSTAPSERSAPSEVNRNDIKCANILVDAYGLIKLADFGLAKETSKLNELKSCKGSAYWMAPEVIHPRKTYWLPADIWSLGCTVLEMLTRSPPYGGLEWNFEDVSAIAESGAFHYVNLLGNLVNVAEAHT